MKPKTFLTGLLLLLLGGAAYFWFSKNVPPAQTPLPLTEPQFLEGTFFEAPEGGGAFIQSQEPFEVFVQGAMGGKSVAVSWDESKIDIFHLVLLDSDWKAMWLLSALDSGAVPESREEIARKDISLFVPSGYVLGERMEGLWSFEDPMEFEFIAGQEYYLQMLGFSKDGQEVDVNKKFIFR